MPSDSDTGTDSKSIVNQPESDSEKEWGQKFGWFYSADSERVYNPQDGSSGPLIITEDGEIEDRYVGRAMRKKAEGKGGLWGRLGPIEIDGIEIRQNTKLWHETHESWLRAVEIDLVQEPEVEPTVTFVVEGRRPHTEFTYRASRLEELRDQGILESQKEVNDRAENMLEQFREKQNAD